MIGTYRGISPNIDPSAFIAETAAVVGDVTIGKNCSVWFGASVRGDESPITIGDGTNVQDNVTLHCELEHPMRIGRNVTIGHNAVVHCNEVGDNTLIGMGAVVLTGAVIGSGCLIAAGAVVRENEVVPDGMLMAGVPAKPVRHLSESQSAGLAQESYYVSLSREYLAGGKA